MRGRGLCAGLHQQVNLSSCWVDITGGMFLPSNAVDDGMLLVYLNRCNLVDWGGLLLVHVINMRHWLLVGYCTRAAAHG